jgi:hypothetical protein
MIRKGFESATGKNATVLQKSTFENTHQLDQEKFSAVGCASKYMTSGCTALCQNTITDAPENDPKNREIGPGRAGRVPGGKVGPSLVSQVLARNCRLPLFA